MSLTAEVINALDITEEELIKKFIVDIKEVFSSMVGIDLMHVPLQIDPVSHFHDCVTAMVGLAGTFNGLVSIHVPSEMALFFTSSMLGMDVEDIDDDVRDALGEIANMITGSFKQHLSKGGADVKLSTPSVVTGSEYVITSMASENSFNLLFSTDDEWFMVNVSFESI